jgi:hypothetical protein
MFLRLQTLADVLRQNNPMLNMGCWQTCACGYAAIEVPAFQQVGFKYDDVRGTFKLGPLSGMKALTVFFAIDELDVQDLFCTDINPLMTGEEMAVKIENFIFERDLAERQRSQRQAETRERFIKQLEEHTRQIQHADHELRLLLDAQQQTVREPERSHYTSFSDFMRALLRRPAVYHDTPARLPASSPGPVYTPVRAADQDRRIPETV